MVRRWQSGRPRTDNLRLPLAPRTPPVQGTPFPLCLPVPVSLRRNKPRSFISVRTPNLSPRPLSNHVPGVRGEPPGRDRRHSRGRRVSDSRRSTKECGSGDRGPHRTLGVGEEGRTSLFTSICRHCSRTWTRSGPAYGRPCSGSCSTRSCGWSSTSTSHSVLTPTLVQLRTLTTRQSELPVSPLPGPFYPTRDTTLPPPATGPRSLLARTLPPKSGRGRKDLGAGCPSPSVTTVCCVSTFPSSVGQSLTVLRTPGPTRHVSPFRRLPRQGSQL